jgi:hypothetical protein
MQHLLPIHALDLEIDLVYNEQNLGIYHHSEKTSCTHEQAHKLLSTIPHAAQRVNSPRRQWRAEQILRRATDVQFLVQPSSYHDLSCAVSGVAKLVLWGSMNQIHDFLKLCFYCCCHCMNVSS